jgi:hypothetical protein
VGARVVFSKDTKDNEKSKRWIGINGGTGSKGGDNWGLKYEFERTSFLNFSSNA